MRIDQILLEHGGGGKASHDLLRETILPAFMNPILSPLNDGAIFELEGKRWAFSTDTYVVDPIFFPGGNIGDLAVNGTVNDIAMCGATPMYLSIGLTIEEGFSITELKKILKSMRHATEEADVKVVTGDTKVVQRGSADKIFINSTGIGSIPENVYVSSNRAQPGDDIILNGSIADHGIAVLTQREGISFVSTILSDTAPLNHMVKRMLSTCPDIHVLRDPTRGGLGTALNEIADKSKVGIKIYEEKILVKKDVAGACELLGFDPLYVANEGKLIAFVPHRDAGRILSAVQQDQYGKEACIIGKVVAEHPGKVVMKTRIGGTRIVDMLTGEQLPRIC